MKLRHLFPLFALCFNTAWAEFSSTRVYAHPLYWVSSEPYLLDIRGDWTSDCHPGEQKPIISEYTGDSVLVEFEITEHVNCNDVLTPYRVLVDMSDVVDDVPGEFFSIDVTIRFGGDEHMERVFRGCPLCSPVPPPRDVKPESGIYYSNDLEKQGLLLARQNQRMGAYPLIYDGSGSSEWVLGPGGIVEDVFFAELFESTGGQCLGCPPPDDPPQMDAVGKIAMLMDSQGVIQVRINDGLFTTYELLDFGYGSRDIGGYPNHRVPDLSGRWALVEDYVPVPQLPPSENNHAPFPLVFDITLETVTYGPPPPIVTAPPTPPGYVMFSVRDKSGNEITQMKCDYGSDWANSDAEVVCDISDPEINDGDTLYRIKMLSPERLSIDWVGPTIPEIHLPTFIAVRVD
ncbi:MAG: hypothetical protein QNK19_06690 [Xanthomonadales bacterium]|nr:hypothetical protein [Xanthomonadales bacterium]